MKLLVLMLSLGIYAQAQTAQQLIGASQRLTPGCVAHVPGHWNDVQLAATNIFNPGTELGGFTVTVNGVACAIRFVGPERLVFWMPVNAPLGDYSAIVNTPTGMRSVALHVVEASPSLRVHPNGISGLYSPIAMPAPRSIGPNGLINMPEDASSVIVLLFASGLNPAANLEREVIITSLSQRFRRQFPVLGVGAPGGPHSVETLAFVLSSIPAGDYHIVVKVGTEFSEAETLTIHSNAPGFRSIRPTWLRREIE